MMSIRMLDFYADWCGPCKTQDPILAEIDAEFDDVALEKIDVEADADTANEYQVRSLPTVIIEADEGVVDRFVGVTQRESIVAAIEQAR